ncbi:MAG TPA: hypothetical protein VNN73_15680 [Blastocatellia bacterium]|nr:hypothetical protein [Blastocatellia bacterium]
MVLIKTKLATAIVVTLSLALAAFGQQPQPAQPQPAPQPARESQYVDFTGFKGKVFDVKHRDPSALVRALAPLTSGFKGATIQSSDEFKTITVRDFPENIAAIEEALKRLDTPLPPQTDVELRMHILIASNVEGVTSQAPSDLSDVLKQLQATLNYKNYTNIATVVQRVRDGARVVQLNGQAEIPGSIGGRDRSLNSAYEYQVQAVNLTSDASGGNTVQLRDTTFNFGGEAGSARIRTDLSLRSGEKVVVGTATLGNKGLILVLSARSLK